MNDDELMSVGRFAKLAGCTVHALRHYDAVRLLPPAEVDEQTGYRRYAPSQLATARLIKDLRWLSIPIRRCARSWSHLRVIPLVRCSPRTPTDCNANGTTSIARSPR